MQISSIVRISTQGVSRPYVCCDESGGLFWCKGSHTGFRAVMAEWICAKIAHALALPVPECCISRLDYDYFDAWRKCNGVDVPQIVTPANQYVFASENVETAKDVINVDADLNRIDPLVLAQIYLFDALINNTDRTDYNSNLLINHGVHMIDHNNAFDPSFDAEKFHREHILRKFFDRASARDVADFRHLAGDTITASFIDSLWSEMPSEWLDTGEIVFPIEQVKKTLCGGLKA